MRFLDIDRPLGQFLCKIGDMATLNFLWILCSIPLVTMGASTTALYFSWMKRYQRGDSPIHRYFLSSFKKNLRQSTAAWLLILSVSLLLILDIMFLKSMNTAAGRIGQYFFTIVFAAYMLISLYLFPAIAAFHATVKQHFKNAAVFAVSNPLITLALFFSSVIPAGLTYYGEEYLGISLFCWMFFGFGLLGGFHAKILLPVFRKYL